MNNKARHVLSMFTLSVFVFLAFGSTDTSPQKSSGRNLKPQTDAQERLPTSTPRPIVSNSAWDGSVRQVKDYLEKNLKDPDSVQYIEWSPVMEMSGGSFSVRCKYRAKNSFGGYVIEENIFYLDSSGAVFNSDNGELLLQDQKNNGGYSQPASKANIWRDEDGNLHVTN